MVTNKKNIIDYIKILLITLNFAFINAFPNKIYSQIKKNTSISIGQNNGYYFFLGQRAGSNLETEINFSKNKFSIWGTYDNKNKQLQEVDLGYKTNLLSKENKNKSFSISIDGELNYWMYPSGSVAGKTNDLVLKPSLDLSLEIIKGSKTEIIIDSYYLIDNDKNKNGGAYTFNISQSISNLINNKLDCNINISSTFGKGLYNLYGLLNNRVGINLEKKINNFVINSNINYQFSNKNKLEIYNKLLYGINLTYNFNSKN